MWTGSHSRAIILTAVEKQESAAGMNSSRPDKNDDGCPVGGYTRTNQEMLELAEPQEQGWVGIATGQRRPVLVVRGMEGGRRKMAEMPPSFPSTMGCVGISPRGGCISLWTSEWVLNDVTHPENHENEGGHRDLGRIWPISFEEP